MYLLELQYVDSYDLPSDLVSRIPIIIDDRFSKAWQWQAELIFCLCLLALFWLIWASLSQNSLTKIEKEVVDNINKAEENYTREVLTPLVDKLYPIHKSFGEKLKRLTYECLVIRNAYFLHKLNKQKIENPAQSAKRYLKTITKNVNAGLEILDLNSEEETAAWEMVKTRVSAERSEENKITIDITNKPKA